MSKTFLTTFQEGEAGQQMPDLERPVQAVSKAVANLARVGREMVTTTDDTILKQDMPVAITKVKYDLNM